MHKKLFAIAAVVIVMSLVLTGAAFADTGQPPQGGQNSDRAPRQRGGEITAIGSNSFTLTGRNGESKTITVDANTQYMDKDGNALSFSDLEVGQRAVIAAAKRDGETITAIWVRVFPKPTHYTGGGKVTAVESNSFTFTARNGKTWEFYVDSATLYTDRDGGSHSFADMEVGGKMLVNAVLREDGKWWATLIGFPLATEK